MRRPKIRIVKHDPCSREAKEVIDIVCACFGAGVDQLETVAYLQKYHFVVKREAMCLRLEKEIRKVVHDQATRHAVLELVKRVFDLVEDPDAAAEGDVAVGKVLRFPPRR